MRTPLLLLLLLLCSKLAIAQSYTYYESSYSRKVSYSQTTTTTTTTYRNTPTYNSNTYTSGNGGSNRKGSTWNAVGRNVTGQPDVVKIIRPVNNEPARTESKPQVTNTPKTAIVEPTQQPEQRMSTAKPTPNASEGKLPVGVVTESNH